VTLLGDYDQARWYELWISRGVASGGIFMKARPFLFVALFSIGCGGSATQHATSSPQTQAPTQKTVSNSTARSVDPTAAGMADFNARAEKEALHRDLPKDAAAQESVNPVEASARQAGTVARLLIDKGFGFIRDDSGIEHFFHRSSLRHAVFELLREGQRVEFTPDDSGKGPRARDIRLIEG
jgi:cold shock CspA family protein